MTVTQAGLMVFKVPGAGEFRVNPLELSADIQKRAMYHGIKQRISDKAAIGRDKATGKSATPAEKFEAMKALADHWAQGGDWAMDRTGGGARGPSAETMLVFEALGEIQGVKASEIAERVRVRCEKTGQTQAQWAAAIVKGEGATAVNIRAKMDEIRARAPSAVDVDEELEALMAGGDEGDESAE